MSFPTRLVQSVYLDWFHRLVLAGLPPTIEVVWHEQRAVDLRDADDDAHDGRQRVVLADGEEFVVDVVVLALGHLDAELRPERRRLRPIRGRARVGVPATRAHRRAGPTMLQPGADVIALGFGQAFTDLHILVTEGRGGRFVDGPRQPPLPAERP